MCIVSMFFCLIMLLCSFQTMSFNCCIVFMFTFWTKWLTLKINNVNNNNKQCCSQMAFRKTLVHCECVLLFDDTLLQPFQTMSFNCHTVFMFTFWTKQLALKINNVNNNNKQCCLQMAFKKMHMHCKCVLLFDNIVAIIPNNEFQLLHCFHVHILNKTTNIENQQCQQQQQTMLFANGI